jgi:hypothetical protein
MSNVGIFWFVPARIFDRSAIVTDMTPIGEASDYAGLKTHDRGHFEYWSSLAALGVRELRERRLPTVIAFTEYETYPRGRIVYYPSREQFTIYADRQLHKRVFIDAVVSAFDLPAGCYSIESDPHYARSEKIGPPAR